MKVTLAAPYTDADGKTHPADTTLDLDIAEASHLMFYGLAREASAPAEADTKKKG